MSNKVLLRISCESTGNSKTLEYDDNLLVSDIYEKLNEKFEINPEEKFMLYRPLKKTYLNSSRTLYSYEFSNEEVLIYKSPIRMIKIKMMDNTTKLLSVNESEPISNILDMVLNKLKINLDSKDEYGIYKEEQEIESPTKQKRSSSTPKYTFLYTNSTKWLDTTQTLCYEDIGLDDVLIIKKKLFFTDERLNRNDSVQINLIYNQIKETIIDGTNPCTLEEAILLAAIQCQIQYGDCDANKIKSNIINVDECLPLDYRKHKKVDKLIAEEYYKLIGLNDLNGKFKYIQMCRSLKTYGTTFFLVKEKNVKKKKLIPILLGVTKNSVLRVNPETKEVLEEWQLKQLKRWNYNNTTFSIDFGTNRDEIYIAETDQGNDIAKLINDYIKLISKMKSKEVKSEEENKDVEEVAQIVEEVTNTSNQHKVEEEVKKIDINNYIDLLNTALMYLSKSEECILQTINMEENNNIYSDKTYYQNYKTLSNDIDISTESIKKLSSLSKDDDIEGICNKMVNISSLIEEMTTLTVFNSQYLINNNLVRNSKLREKDTSILMKNYFFKNVKDKEKTNTLYSLPDSESVSSLFKDKESLLHRDDSMRSVDSRCSDIRSISNSENYKLISDKIFLPENYRITMNTKYVVESLKEALLSNNENQRYTILNIDTRIIVEILHKLKIIVYDNIPGKYDCNSFIKKISEVKMNFTELQEKITNESISLENNEDEEIINEDFNERYINIINCMEKNAHNVYDLSKDNYILMITELKQFQDQFCELYPNSYKVCINEYKTMKKTTYLKKYILFLNTLSLYINNLKRMYGDYSNLSMEDDEAYDNVYGELQSLIDILKRVPKQEIKESQKEVVEILAYNNEILSNSDLDRLNKMIEILNNCPKLSDVPPNDKDIEDVKENVMKLQTLSNFMIILCNCMNEIYKFYENLSISNASKIDDNNDNTCEIEYNTKDKLVLYDMLENSTFKFSDITIELFDLLNNEEFKRDSCNLFDNEAELYLDEIKKDLLQIIENEKKIINNENEHKKLWNDNITQIENIQSVLFNLLAHLPKFEFDRSHAVYIIYKLHSIIKDLEENIILSKGEFLNPIQRCPEFSEIHHKRVIQELEIFRNTFNEFIELKSSSEDALLSMIVKTVNIFELFTYMLKISVNSITCLDKEEQKIILNSAKNTAVSLNNVIIDKLGFTEQDIEEITLYMDDYVDILKYEEKLNISEYIKEELLEEFNINLKDTEEKLNSTTNLENIFSNNIHTLYKNINDLIEDVKSSENEKYTIDINDYETLCSNFHNNIVEINSGLLEFSEQIKIYKMYDYYKSFKQFSMKTKQINTVNDPEMKETKNKIIELYSNINPINLRLKVDVISLIDEHREINEEMLKSMMSDVIKYIEKMQDICEKTKDSQINVFTSSKIQKLNNVEKYFEHIHDANKKELEILNSKKFYHGDIGNIIYYMISNSLCSVYVYMKSLMKKCDELFSVSCNSPMENQMYQFDDNWCDLLTNSFTEINETIKTLSSIIHKNTSYVKNIKIYNSLKKVYERLNQLKYISSKKYLLNNEYELWSQTAADNAIRSVIASLTYMEEDNKIQKYKFNMSYVYLFYASFIFYLICSLF